MRKAILPVFALASVFLWVACDSEQPTAPGDLEASFAISDQLHDGGTEGFFWLPPMVDNPNANGEFIGTLSPEVEICELNLGLVPPACDGNLSPLRSFTMESGVEVDVNGQHYQLNWQTDETGVDEEPILDGGTYRISVVLDATLIGFADVQIVKNMGGFKNLDNPTGEVMGLIDGQTLPVKFRIERGVLPAITPIWDIALSTARDGNFEVYLMDTVGGSLVNLSNSPGTMDGGPTWSPDGSMVAFAADRTMTGRLDIYVMNVDGTMVQEDPVIVNGWKPAWSPDGDKIAFQRGWTENGLWDPDNINQDIWYLDLASEVEYQATDKKCLPGGDPYEDIDPTWRPGPYPALSFARTANRENGVCPDTPWEPYLGTPARRVAPAAPFVIESFDIVAWNLGLSDPEVEGVVYDHTYATGIDELTPRWAHHTQRLVFASRTVEQFSDLIIQSWHGQDKVNLTNSPGWINQDPDWSADDSKILFSRGTTDANLGLWMMNPDGTNWEEVLPLASDAMWRPISN